MDLRTPLLRLAIFACAIALLAACAVEEPPEAARETHAPSSSSDDVPNRARGQEEVPDFGPEAAAPREQTQTATEVAGDAVQIGSALGANGAASAPKSVYSLGDTVHASVATGDIGSGSTLTVYWTFQDGRTHKEESLPVPAGDYASFNFSQSDGMQPGLYNVQIDADFQPLGIAEFRVE